MPGSLTPALVGLAPAVDTPIPSRHGGGHRLDGRSRPSGDADPRQDRALTSGIDVAGPATGASRPRRREPPTNRSRWLILAVATAVGVLSVARIAIVADPSSQIWFEDGLFLSCATGDDPAGCVFSSYARYVSVIPRVLVAVVAIFPPAVAGTVIVTLAILVTAVAAGFVTASARRLGLPIWASAAVGLAIALLPDAGAETIGVLVNLQWVLGYAAMWVLLPYSQATTRLRAGSEAGLTALAALTAPGTIALIPIVAVRWATGRKRGQDRANYLAAPIALTVGVLIQVIVYLASPNSPQVGPPETTPLSQRLTYFDGFLRSVTFGTANVARSDIWFLASGIAFVLCFWLLWRNRARPELRTAGLLIGLCALTSFGLTAALRDPAPFRFWVNLGLVFFSLLVVTVAATVTYTPVTNVALGAAGAGLLLLWVAAFPIANVRVATSYSWPTQVSEAAMRCRNEPGLTSVSIRVGPDFFVPAGLEYPCRYLTR